MIRILFRAIERDVLAEGIGNREYGRRKKKRNGDGRKRGTETKEKRMVHDFLTDKRFDGLSPLAKQVSLSSPTAHKEEEMAYIEICYASGWLTTIGENIDELEKTVSSYMTVGEDKKYALALVNGTAAIHLAVKLAAGRVYHSSSGVTTPDGKGAGGSLYGRRVFVSDMTFDASVNPVVYEGGEPIFIDSEYETWNMDPEALERAFDLYPDVRIVIFVHLYGVPGKIAEVRRICTAHNAVLIEDAAESLGADVAFSDGGTYPAGSVGDFGILSFNGNKIITGSSGGMLIVPDAYSYRKAKKWSTQSREDAPWYEHEELGYNYRISNMVAGVVRGQWEYLSAHIAQKKAVFARYKEKLEGLPIKVHGGGNYWLSCALIDQGAMAPAARGSRHAVYGIVPGKSCPTEVLEALAQYHCEGRPIWKPMHLQPIYSGNAYVKKSQSYDIGVSEDLFERGLCLPSDNKMSQGQQEQVIELVRRCF